MNRLLGTIVGVNSNGHVFQVVVQVGSVEITAVALDFTPSDPDAAVGKKAGIVFKEAETALALDLPPTASASATAFLVALSPWRTTEYLQMSGSITRGTRFARSLPPDPPGILRLHRGKW